MLAGAASALLVVLSVVRWLVDLIAEPAARLLLRGRSAAWRWLGAIGPLAAALAATLLVPQPFWLLAAAFGLVVLVTVFREWQRGEDYRERVLDRQSDDDPDLLPDLSALNAVAAAFIVPLFAAVFFRLDAWVGGFVGAHGPADYLLLSLDNLIDVVTLDVGGALTVGTTAVTTDAPWANATVVLQKALLAAMLIGAASSLIRSRQAVEDSIRILDTYPDISLRLGRRGLKRLEARLQSAPPEAIGADSLGKLRTGAAYRLIAETVGKGEPPASTTAIWIATRIRDESLMEAAAARLNAYARFFSVYRSDFIHREEYERAVASNGARALRFKPGRWTAQYQVDPTSAEEIYEAADVADVCQLLDYFTALHEPTPWEDGVSVQVATLLGANSPAIRAAAARYAGKYANFAAQAAPIAGELAGALDRENAPEPSLAMLRALRGFGSREPWVISAVERLLAATDVALRRAAAAVLLASNDAEAVGPDNIDRMLCDPDGYVCKCGAYLIYHSRAVAAEAGVAPHLEHEDEFVRAAVRSFIESARSPLGARAIVSLLLSPHADAGRLAMTLNRAVAERDPDPALLPDLDVVIRIQAAPMAAEYAIYAAGTMRATELVPAVEARLAAELAGGDPAPHVVSAGAWVLAEIADAASLPMLRTLEAWADGADDHVVAERARKGIQRLTAAPPN